MNLTITQIEPALSMTVAAPVVITLALPGALGGGGGASSPQLLARMWFGK